MLAFDRDRVQQLHARTLTTHETIGLWRVDDPEAAGATLALNAARALLEAWFPLLFEVAVSDVMERHHAAGGRDGTRLDLEVRLLSERVGWTVVDDGTADRAVLRDAEVIRLLSHLDDEHLRRFVIDVVVSGDAATIALVGASLPAFVIGQCGRADALLVSLPLDVAHVLAVNMGRTPQAARAVLAAVDQLELGLIGLLTGPADLVAVTDLVRRAVSDLSPVDAGPIVLPFVRAVVDGHTSDNSGYRALLGPVVAPYVLQFTSRSEDWGISERDGGRLLAGALRDDRALEMFVAERDRWLANAPTADSAHDVDRLVRHLDDLAGMLGWLDAIFQHEEVDAGLADRAMWDASWFVVGAAVSLAVASAGAGAVAQPLVDRVTDEVLGRVKGTMEDSGTLGAPDSEEQVHVDALTRHDWRRVTLASAAATATVEVLRSRGATLPDPPPAPNTPTESCSSSEWLDEFDRWSVSVDRRSRRTVDLAVRTVLNRYQAAEACHALDG